VGVLALLFLQYDIYKDINFLIIIFLLGGILSLILFQKCRSFLNNRRAKKRAFISKHAEKNAEKWLKKNGFRILEKQKNRPLIIQAGNARYRYLIRTDFLVKKGSSKYIVEVKSGKKNNNIANRDTRRQLLEYFLAYPSYGIILFDMENKNFSEIKFILPCSRPRWLENLIFFLFGALIITVILYLMK